MSAPWDALVTTGIGAAATVAGILVGGIVGRRNQNQQWLRDTPAAAYAAYLREFTAIEIELREAYLDDRSNTADWAPFNAALASLSLVATPEAADAASELTEAVGRLALMVADQGPKDRDELRQIMSDLASRQVSFVDAARSSLDASQQPLSRQLGGPAALARDRAVRARATLRRMTTALHARLCIPSGYLLERLEYMGRLTTAYRNVILTTV